MDANYDATGELTEGITVNTINGETQKFEHVQTTALIPVDTACQKVYYTGQVFNWIGVAGYDANGTFVASILDSRDTEQPQEYKEKELEIPEGVFQIRASSYAKDLSLKVCGESAKLWNQVQRERQNQKKMAVEIEALRSADDALAKETMTSLNLPFLYDGVSNIWEGSSPVLQTYYVPLTVLRSVFIQEIQFTLRTIGETTLTAMLESEEGEVFRQSVELVKGDNRITLILHRFIDEGAYKLRVRSTDKVLYYPVRPNTGKEIRNDFFSNEPSGNVEYDYKNRLIVFMGKILIGTGKVDTTLSYSGMAADAAIVGQAFKEEREYTDTLASGKLDAVRSRNLLDPSRYRPGWFAFVHSSIIQYHADNLRYGSTDYIPVSEKGLVTKGSGTNGVTSQVVFDKAKNGKKKLLWLGDKNKTLNYAPAADEMILTVHRWFANKSCPGNWLYARLGDLAARVTAALGGSSSSGLQASSLKNLSEAEAVAEIGPLFTENQKQSGILACVSMTQFILESGYGKSELAQNANNCFGMKTSLSGNSWSGSSWDGKSVYTKKTQEQNADGSYVTITADFRKYACVEDSIADHAAYLLGAMNGSRKRYEGLAGCTDYKKAVQIIKDGGYATSHTYVQNLCNIIERWNLTQYNASAQNQGGNISGWYRVRKSWQNAASQKGAFHDLSYAKQCADANPGYTVFDPAGKAVYPVNQTASVPYAVRVSINDLNIRKGPGTNYGKTGYYTGKGVFTIVAESAGTGSVKGWGKLKSGAGWIALDFAARI